MMSSERETYLLTLSPLPKGDILNSSNTMPFLSSNVTICLCRPPAPRLTFSPTHPRRNHSHPPTHRLLCNRLPGTSLFPFIEPHFGILHLAQQPEAVQGFPQHRASFLDVRLIALRLLAQLAKPVDERDELAVQDALQIFFHKTRQRWRHTARADRDARMPGFDDRRHVDRGGFGEIDRPQRELPLARLRQRQARR